MKVRRNPLENNSFILVASDEDASEMRQWLTENKIRHVIQSNIITLYNDIDKNYFILRWLDR